MKNITEIGETKPSLKERYQNINLFIIQTFHQLRMSTALHVEFFHDDTIHFLLWHYIHE